MYASFVIMILYTTFAMTRWRRGGGGCVESSGLLGAGATVTVALSMASVFSLCASCGVPLTQTSQILPFVLVGIGADDAFIVKGALDQIDPQAPMSDRFATCIRECGPSTAVTTLTKYCCLLIRDSVVFHSSYSLVLHVCSCFCPN